MSNLIQLTVEPHVERYIKHWYGARIILSDDSTITSLLKSVMRPFDKVNPHRVRPSVKYDLGGWIDIYVSDGMLRKYGGYISDKDIKSFSRVVDLMIKQEMYRWCSHPSNPDNIVDYNIQRFMEFYRLYDEVTFDNFKRWYYRDRERREKRRTVQLKDVVLTIPLALKEMSRPNGQIALF